MRLKDVDVDKRMGRWDRSAGATAKKQGPEREKGTEGETKCV